MRESIIEKAHRAEVERVGGELWKFTSPGRRARPDRLRLLPVPPEHRALVAKYLGFVEFKSEGKDVTPGGEQDRMHRDIRRLGYDVQVVNTMPGAC